VAALNHPNIVTLHSLEEAAGMRFLTMELVQGRTLDRLIVSDGLGFEELLGYALPLTAALGAAHERGIVHRDLKPGNVMVTEDGRIKLLDFGLATSASENASLAAAEAGTGLSREGTLLGTFRYMSPEQLQGRRPDCRSDVFSMGMVLYQLATGHLPFGGETFAEVSSAILRDRPAELSELRPDLPRPLSVVVMRCLEKDPARRTASAADLHYELEQLSRGAAAEKSARPAEAPPSGAPRRPSLAVLPLVNLAGDPAQEYVADGLTEMLITDLAKISGIKVISRTSVMAFKHSRQPLPVLAGALGADFVLEGSVLQAGARVRVSVQLLRAATDEHLWAEHYEDELADVLHLQRQVAETVAREIDVQLTIRDEERLGKRRSVDPEVYLLTLKGREYWSAQRTEQGFRAGLDCFQKAIALDPTYAPAYVGLADCLNMLANYGIVAPADTHLRAQAALTKALELEPKLAEAHRARALCRWQFEYDWKRAEEEYLRSLELDPGAAQTCYWFGVFLSIVGRADESLKWLRRTEEIDPLSLVVPSMRGWALLFARRYGEAVDCLKRVLVVDPNFMIARWFLGETYAAMGEAAAAAVEMEKATELSGRTSRMLGYLGYAYGRADLKREAQGLLDELEARSRHRYVPPYFLALAASGLGERGRILDELERSYSVRDAMIRDLKVDPPWDLVRSEPRYLELLHRMNFPA
jgi:TolB-like protein/Flp pilus assembly protein TadD